MPRYGFYCPACRTGVELALEPEALDGLVFCPHCHGVLRRDAADYASVSVGGRRDAPELLPHVHHAGCGCAMAVDWEARAAAIEAEERGEGA